MSEEEKKQEQSKWAQYAKFLTSVAALLAALGTALIALQESKNKAPEKSSKAAHNELVSKLEALDKDIEGLNKRFKKQLSLMERNLNFGIASAKSDADSVRALFTGYALAARGKSSVAIKEIARTVKDARDKSVDLLKSKPQMKQTTQKPRARSYKSPKKWESF